MGDRKSIYKLNLELIFTEKEISPVGSSRLDSLIDLSVVLDEVGGLLQIN